MNSFKEELKTELEAFCEKFEWSFRMKKDLFIIESEKHDIHHLDVETMTQEIEGCIGGNYEIEEAYGKRAVIKYNN